MISSGSDHRGTRDETATGRVRARCVWWLSGQCKGGATCTCLPWPRRPDTGPAPEPPNQRR